MWNIRIMMAALLAFAASTASADRLRVYSQASTIVFTYTTSAPVITFGPPSTYVGHFVAATTKPADIVFHDSFERGMADPWAFQIINGSGGTFASGSNCTYLRYSSARAEFDLEC